MVDDIRHFSKPLAAGMAGVGFLIAFLVGIHLLTGVITLDYYMPIVPFALASNIVIIPILLYLATRYVKFKLVALVWVHLSMSLMIVYLNEIYSPFTPAWSILTLVSSTYYGWRGFAGSTAALVATGVMYIVLFSRHIDSLLNYSLLSLLVIILTAFISYLFVRIIMGNHKKNRELENAHRSERLQINRLNTLLNSISDAVLTLNRYGRVTSQNAAAQAFFDTNQSLIGRDIDSLLSLKDKLDKPVTLHNLIGSVKSTLTRDDLSHQSDGTEQHLSIQISRIRSTYDDNEEYGVVLIIRDITKQKTLEDEKDEFISVTSHELRTPVAIAEGSLSNLLVMSERGAKPEKLRSSAETAHEQVIYLAKMINDLSTLSRAERGIGDVVEEINVNELVQDLYTRYTPEAEAKSLHLNLDTETNLPSIKTSRLYLEEILQNFITNSIKYTNNGSVTLGAKMVPDSAKMLFFVTDTGIGMNKADVAHIFEKFYRSEDYRTRETSGTGLGLYVVSKLAQKLNTKIDVESRLNHGSTFSFVLSLQTHKFGTTSQGVTGEAINKSSKPQV